MMVEYSLLLEKQYPGQTGDTPMGVADIHTDPLIDPDPSLPAGKPGGTR
jgi:hypothetical protein